MQPARDAVVLLVERRRRTGQPRQRSLEPGRHARRHESPMVWGAIVGGALTDGGLHGTTIGGLLLIVITASVLFDRRHVVGFVALCLLTLLGFLALELTGLLPTPTSGGSTQAAGEC